MQVITALTTLITPNSRAHNTIANENAINSIQITFCFDSNFLSKLEPIDYFLSYFLSKFIQINSLSPFQSKREKKVWHERDFAVSRYKRL